MSNSYVARWHLNLIIQFREFVYSSMVLRKLLTYLSIWSWVLCISILQERFKSFTCRFLFNTAGRPELLSSEGFKGKWVFYIITNYNVLTSGNSSTKTSGSIKHYTLPNELIRQMPLNFNCIDKMQTDAACPFTVMSTKILKRDSD